MNSYLKIAETILRRSKKPLTAKEILEAAYKSQLVPPHLYGKMQHKTIHARLAEDVLYNRVKTIFVRTGPGRFALRADTSDSRMLANRYVAPLRSYQLKRYEVLCAKRGDLENAFADGLKAIEFAKVSELFRFRKQLISVEKDDVFIHLRLLVTLRNSDATLSVLDESSFGTKPKRAIGLFGQLKDSDVDLFSSDTMGLDHASRRIILEQTSCTMHRLTEMLCEESNSNYNFLYLSGPETKRRFAVVVTAYCCNDPDAIINAFSASRAPRWTRGLSGINDIETLDEISKQILSDNDLSLILDI